MAIFGKLVASVKALVMNALKPTPAPFFLSHQDFSQSDPEASASLLHADLGKQGRYLEVPSAEPKSELPIPGTEDPAVVRQRKIVGYVCGFLALQSLLPLVLAIVMSQLYVDAETNASKAAAVQPMRCVSPSCTFNGM